MENFYSDELPPATLGDNDPPFPPPILDPEPGTLPPPILKLLDDHLRKVNRLMADHLATVQGMLDDHLKNQRSNTKPNK
ncbi:MAG: hypothetical protein JST83_14055 [Bacteroidetes bacterium]|nr:hypothetical protein [Bacteroidota bacterium]